MSPETYEGALASAAERCGVEPRFWDIFGREHVASSGALRAILKAIGIPADSADSIHAALHARDREEWIRTLAPAIVLTRTPDRVRVAFTLPESELRGTARFRVHLETGEWLEAEHTLSGLRWEDQRQFEQRWVRVAVDLALDLPLGYHTLQIRSADRNASAALIVAPDSAWQPESLAHGGKAAGFAVALYGLRSARNWGCGDFTDLRRLCTWAARDLRVSFIALNPLHATHNRRPYNTSPYLPNSLFSQNSLYLDVEAIEEWKSNRRAQRCFASAQTQSELHLLREAPEVEYERIQQLKTRFLKLLFAGFLRAEWAKDSRRAQEFRAFQQKGGDLSGRFGLYCALDEHLHRLYPDTWIWTQWPQAYQDPQSPEVQGFAKKHWRSVLFFQYAAWQCSVQLEAAQKHAVQAGLPIGLYHDLALATDRFGSDIWAHRDFFAQGCRVGSPPDDFSPQGQDWGFPPPNALRHREDGYQLFRASILASCRHGGALRIDHVMRFFRLYWIPDGMDATQGTYVRDNAEDLVRILALESFRNRVLIVGEDLGTVEPHIREMLARYGILSYRLLLFERHGDGSYRTPEEYPRQALVSSSTHDLPTVTGFWTGADIEARLAAGVLDEHGHRNQWSDRTRDKQRMLDTLFQRGLLPNDYPRNAAHVPEMDTVLHNAVIAFLAATPSMLMLINQEDLTLETHQQNLPGTTSQYPNWGRKMLWTLEQLDFDAHARELVRRMKEQVQNSGRT